MKSRVSVTSTFATLALLGGSALAQITPTPEEGDTATDDTTDDTVTDPVAVPPSDLPPPDTTTPVADPEPPPTVAHEPGPSLVPAISGHINGTYVFNFGDPADTNTFHSYSAVHNSFYLNAAHVVISGSDGHTAYAIEIDAGTDALVNSSTDPALGAFGGLLDIQEGWVSYTADSGLGVKAGKFATYMGIEVIESHANPTITRGFLFGLAEPLTHTGAVVTYKASDEIDVAIGAVNGWDLLVDNNGAKTIVAKGSFNSEALGLTVSALAGPEQEANNDDWRMSFDATGVYRMDQLALWFQGNFGMEQAGDESASWFGAGVQPMFAINDQLSVGGRLEFFADPDNERTGGAFEDGLNLINVSATPAYKVGDHLVFRGELRLDFATEDVYVSADPDADASGIQIVSALEAIAIF